MLDTNVFFFTFAYNYIAQSVNKVYTIMVSIFGRQNLLIV